MTEKEIKLSIIIPAYNEEDRIVATLDQTRAYLARQAYRSEILVVSDGSTDDTGQVVDGYPSDDTTTIRFLEYFPNRGKGYAVRYGMCKGAGDVILFMDADYSVPIEAVEKGLAQLESGYDAAIASRALPESNVVHHQNVFRELSAKLYTFIQNTYLGFNYPDTQCGFKLFTRKAAHDLFARQKLDSVIFDPEILWLAKRQGYTVAQFPVDWTHMEDSRIQYDSLRKSLFVFQELFRIRSLH
ncbi:MAG: glycosyltransferase family 2 protein [Desulfobacterales bacterium]|nr:glycosyltransferase family 2 protein [Desulfobacterales bacterium]